MRTMNMHRHRRSDYRGLTDEVANADVPIKCVTAEEREKPADRKEEGMLPGGLKPRPHSRLFIVELTTAT